MITIYHRPQTLEQGIALISRSTPKTLPLGGGTSLSHRQPESIEVVDLQDLGLNQIRKTGNNLEIGATATIQQLIESDEFPRSLKPALKIEAPINIRNIATAAGMVVTADGRSAFITAMLALDAKLFIQPDDQEVFIGNLLPLRETLLQGKLITLIVIPTNVKIAFAYISRTPSDKPIVCITLVRWSSGRTRLALGGYGRMPILAMDGTESDNLEDAAFSAFYQAGDSWASVEYRQDVAKTLVKRCLSKINLAN